MNSAGLIDVYLLHFMEPYYHARHYVGGTDSLARRIREHQQGMGSKLVRAVNKAGIPWVVARVWHGSTWAWERKLHERHETRLFCPYCNPAIAVDMLPLPKKVLDALRWHIPAAATQPGGLLAPEWELPIVLPQGGELLSPAWGMPVEWEAIPYMGDGILIEQL
jgi:predicted GIY-YIG superfamily endonuclease